MTTVAVLRRPVRLTIRFQRGLRRALQAKVPQLEREDRVKVVDRLQRSSRLDFDFCFLICASTLIASLGLIANSVPVVIGAMRVFASIISTVARRTWPHVRCWSSS